MCACACVRACVREAPLSSCSTRCHGCNMLYRVATCWTVLQHAVPCCNPISRRCGTSASSSSARSRGSRRTTTSPRWRRPSASARRSSTSRFGLAHCWVCRKAVPTQCAVLCSRLIPVQMWHVMSCVWPAHITARQWSAFQPALVEGRVCAIWHIAVGLTRYRLHHHARIRGRHCLGRYYFVERLDEAIPLHTPLCSSCSEICEYERHTHARARAHRNAHTRIYTNRNMRPHSHTHTGTSATSRRR